MGCFDFCESFPGSSHGGRWMGKRLSSRSFLGFVCRPGGHDGLSGAHLYTRGFHFRASFDLVLLQRFLCRFLFFLELLACDPPLGTSDLGGFSGDRRLGACCGERFSRGIDPSVVEFLEPGFGLLLGVADGFPDGTLKFVHGAFRSRLVVVRQLTPGLFCATFELAPPACCLIRIHVISPFVGVYAYRVRAVWSVLLQDTP